MKKLLLSIAIFCAVTGVSFADNGNVDSAATASAHQIQGATNLNEIQYLKVKKIERNRFQEISEVKTKLAGAELETSLKSIQEKYNAEIVALLTVDQKIKFIALKEEQTALKH